MYVFVLSFDNLTIHALITNTVVLLNKLILYLV